MVKHRNVISGLSIITSLLFILSLKYSIIAAFGFIVITLLLDLTARLTARGQNKNSEEFHVIDAASARLSEGIIFSVFFAPWFYLFALNNILTVINFKKRKYPVLPLRLIFTVFFFFRYMI